ncbi:uncharacterized conserved protein [Bellilinea caldifistulae]|uniref:DUF1641 domain-containing protein n=1 Tax=Bellilinea caldifistulae TaxID=360411 RepID=A0A0P6WTU6_9CHLR|nr:DUF1641 domain-containing protein [Bellilinea caldifistulae]KPL73672.1 hypothetical protein AC812_14990 [Bellilinea caldifistulae]GAP10316.1 uncharacterized conserved protein [Bellilinea caldifistulae]
MTLETDLLALNQKLDALTAQVAYLTEQARLAQQERESRADLVDTAMPIAREAMDIVTRELEEVQEEIRMEDLLRLSKKLLRHVPQLEMLLDQLDSLSDLLATVGPISREMITKLTDLMDELDRKGYFAFARGGGRLVDNVVTSFTEEDVNRLSDNIVLILNTVKDMTQPEIMSFVRNTLLLAEEEVSQPVDTSMWSILRQMQDPAVRRGLALTLRILRAIGVQSVNGQPVQSSS